MLSNARWSVEPVARELSRALVLLVDDCADTREMYAECLSASFDIIEAGSGAEALTKAAELCPSAIVMDLSLPDMGGEQVIASLRRNANTRCIPVVVVSGFSEPQARGAIWDAYLVKPCSPDRLSDCIDRMLGAAPESSVRRRF